MPRQTAEGITQLEIPGTATKQEKMLEEMIDGYDDCAGRIADIKTVKQAHKKKVEELMVKMGKKLVRRNGGRWERNMKLTRTEEKDPDAEKDAPDSEKGKASAEEKFEPKAASAAAS